jgi:hypothetical protein
MSLSDASAVRHGGAASERISERCCVRPIPSGKCVWFELPAGATP